MPRPIDPERHRARRLQIIDAGLSVFARKGYGEATTAAICSEAGIGSGTFFHYFPTKDSLLLAVLHEGATVTEGFFSGQEGRTDSVQVVLDWVRYAVQDLRDPRATGFIAVVAGQSMRDEFATALQTQEQITRTGLRRWLESAQDAGQTRTDLTAERLADWVMLIVDGFAGRVGNNGEFDVTAEESLLHEVITTFLAGSATTDFPPPQLEHERRTREQE